MKIFVLLRKAFKTESQHKGWYNRCLNSPWVAVLYRRRQPSIEPVFALIKELFDLKGEAKLPYKGLAKVEAYLLLTTVTVQVLMIFNSIYQHPLQATKPFRFAFD